LKKVAAKAKVQNLKNEKSLLGQPKSIFPKKQGKQKKITP